MKILTEEFKTWFKHKFLRIHDWKFHQVVVDCDGSCKTMVLAWQQCNICTKTRLVHILGS